MASKHNPNNSTLYDYDPDAQPDEQQTITICHVEEPHDIYGGRGRGGYSMRNTEPPAKGWLGNPYRVADFGRDECIEMFEDAFYQTLRKSRRFTNAVASLEGQVVACHCRHRDEDAPKCHLDIVRNALLEGHVHRIAHSIHGIALTEGEMQRMCDPEELL